MGKLRSWPGNGLCGKIKNLAWEGSAHGPGQGPGPSGRSPAVKHTGLGTSWVPGVWAVEPPEGRKWDDIDQDGLYGRCPLRGPKSKNGQKVVKDDKEWSKSDQSD